MAASAKKILDQNALRQLMKDRRDTLNARTNKIDSPFAKFNNSGQLICTLCNAQIKHERLWKAHILGKTHKENVDAANKKEEDSQSFPLKSCIKRKNQSDLELSNTAKISKYDDKSSSKLSDVRSYKELHDVKRSMVGSYNSSFEDGEDIKQTNNSQVSLPGPDVPADFFDLDSKKQTQYAQKSTVLKLTTKPEADQSRIETEKRSNAVEDLPEGFFDDPKLGAKVKKIEYKDPNEEEWEKFMKTIAEETTLSEAIIAEDIEESKAEREIDEIDEQIHNWSRVEALQSKKDKLMEKNQKERDKAQENSNSDVDELELEELSNWRAKDVWKH